mgnify:CR=1 FL=1
MFPFSDVCLIDRYPIAVSIPYEKGIIIHLFIIRYIWRKIHEDIAILSLNWAVALPLATEQCGNVLLNLFVLPPKLILSIASTKDGTHFFYKPTGQSKSCGSFLPVLSYKLQNIFCISLCVSLGYSESDRRLYCKVNVDAIILFVNI